MGKNVIICSLSLPLFVVPLWANNDVIFIDETYGSQLTEGALNGSSSSGTRYLYLDLYY